MIRHSNLLVALVCASALPLLLCQAQEKDNAVECVFSQFADPISVNDQACCAAIVGWVGAGSDEEQAASFLQAICRDAACSATAQSVFQATPPGLIVDPTAAGCGEDMPETDMSEEAEGFACPYSQFSDPITVPDSSCCNQIQAWIGFGLDLQAAQHALDLICQKEDGTTMSCAQAAQQVYQTTPAFVQDTLVEPICDDSSSATTTVDWNCTIQGDPSGTPLVVPGEDCCASIQGWMVSNASSMEDMCHIEGQQVVTSSSQSCVQVASSLYETLSNFLVDLPLPTCSVTVHILAADFGQLSSSQDEEVILHSDDVSNHKCLQGVVARELLLPLEEEEAWMKMGACSEDGFGLPSPDDQPVSLMTFDFYYYTDVIVAYNLDSRSPYCAEARLRGAIQLEELPPGATLGSCSGQGYERPRGNESSPFGELLLFGPGIDTPPQRTVHLIDYPKVGKCAEKRVPMTEAEQLVLQEGYLQDSCARSNYFVHSGNDDEFTIWSMPPSEPQVVEYNWDFRAWTIDYERGQPVGRESQTSLEMSGSQRKNALLYGGHYPGPLVEAIEDDLIQVRLANEAVFGESTTIHWHGLHMRGTPFADGAQMISQLPLGPYQSMQYSFKADPPGTHFYHSHIPLQRALGAMGPILLHSRNDPHRHLYDEDRIIFISDEVREPRLICEGSIDDYPLATGPGTRTYFPCLNHALAHSFNGEVGNGTVAYPYHQIPVEEGKCYRLRFILGSDESVYVVIQLAGHNMTVVAVDGTPIVPMEVESFHLQQGARVDAIVCADQEPGMYDLLATDELICQTKDLGIVPTCTYHAFLSYDTFHAPPPDTPPAPEGPIPGVGGGRKATIQTNGINLDFDRQETYRGINSIEDTAVDESIEPYRVNLKFGMLGDEYSGFEQLLNTAHRWYLSENKKTWYYPSNGGIPLMQEPSCYDPEKTPIVDIPEDAEEVEVLINNLTPFAHNLHIHGMRAKVINVGHYDWAYGTGQFRFLYNETRSVDYCTADGGTIELSDPTAQTLNNAKTWGCIYNASVHGVSSNYENPVERDVFNVPRRGWLIVRFKADNPGIWPFHCHVADHAMGGAMTAFSVLPSQIPNAPEDFGPKRTCLLKTNEDEPETNEVEQGGEAEANEEEAEQVDSAVTKQGPKEGPQLRSGEPQLKSRGTRLSSIALPAIAVFLVVVTSI